MKAKLTFDDFSKENLKRCESPQGFESPVGSWSLSDWFTALTGELGEAANVAKKLNRIRDGIPGNKDASEETLRAQLADEMADTFIYLDLLCQSQGISLADAVLAKFDSVSERISYPKKLGELYER